MPRARAATGLLVAVVLLTSGGPARASDGGPSPPIDLVVALDVSDSTIQSTGVDLNGDGVVDDRKVTGVWPGSRPPRSSGDSILGFQVLVVRKLLATLDPTRTRVGLVMFSGDPSPQSPDAVVRVPTTHDFNRIGAALDQILEVGPAGRTNLAAAIETSSAELVRAAEEPDAPPLRRALVILITDGRPTLPVPLSGERNDQSLRKNARMARAKAKRAHKTHGISFHACAMGEDSFGRRLLRDIAEDSGGSFVLAPAPPDLPDFEFLLEHPAGGQKSP